MADSAVAMLQRLWPHAKALWRDFNTYCDVTQCTNGLWIFMIILESPRVIRKHNAHPRKQWGVNDNCASTHIVCAMAACEVSVWCVQLTILANNYQAAMLRGSTLRLQHTVCFQYYSIKYLPHVKPVMTIGVTNCAIRYVQMKLPWRIQDIFKSIIRISDNWGGRGIKPHLLISRYSDFT